MCWAPRNWRASCTRSWGWWCFLALMFLFVRLVKYNLPEPQDRLWFANVKDVLKGRHIKSLQVGKYNAGKSCCSGES